MQIEGLDSRSNTLFDTAARVSQERREPLDGAHLACAALADQANGVQLPPGLVPDVNVLLRDLLASVGAPTGKPGDVTDGAQGSVLRAMRLRQQFGLAEVSPELLLLALVADPGVGVVLARHGVTDEVARGLVAPPVKEVEGVAPVVSGLDRFGRDLTAAAKDGRLDPVIGRDWEIRRVMQVLARRSKNNPVLVGEPGVGKTAVIEGLAQRIVAGDVPESLRGTRLVELDLTALLAGTKHRGDFEERLSGILAEIEAGDGSILPFIDEIHTLVGAGASGDGGNDAGNMLKPLLARGRLRLIGATTLDEHRRYIEKDPALARRFQPVNVGEPEEEDAIVILRGLRERYEQHHGVRIADSALTAAVRLTSRYLADRRLPDKAIDAVDEAASRMRLLIESRPAELDEVERTVRRLEVEQTALAREEGAAAQTRRAQLEPELVQARELLSQMMSRWETSKRLLDQVRAAKATLETAKTSYQKAERELDLQGAAALYNRIPGLEAELQQARAALSGAGLLSEEVTAADVGAVVSEWTGIPSGRLEQSEHARLQGIGVALSQRVIGQQMAVNAVAAAVRRVRTGAAAQGRPASFLFMGPTGTGKTELAKVLAEFLFDTPQAFIRLDMSEFGEAHTVSRLIGAPPGFRGSDSGGELTEKVRQHPFSVVLLDEAEKAHPDVLKLLLQVLDDGRLTDSHGRLVTFAHAIVVLTSNLGAEQLIDESQPVEERMKAAQADLATWLRPEELNRLDAIVPFLPLDKEALGRVADLMVAGLQRRISELGVDLSVTPAARGWLVDRGHVPALGARPLRRLVDNHVADLVADTLLASEARGPLLLDVTPDGQLGLRPSAAAGRP